MPLFTRLVLTSKLDCVDRNRAIVLGGVVEIGYPLAAFGCGGVEIERETPLHTGQQAKERCPNGQTAYQILHSLPPE
jgi:hypothetical protein